MSIAECLSLQVKPKVTKPLILVYWYRPPVNWVKVNTDGAHNSLTNFSAVAGIIRCSNGRVLKCFQKFLGQTSIFFVELNSIVFALALCKQLGFRKVIVESDAASVIDSLKHLHSLKNWRMLHLYSHLQVIIKEMEVIFCHIHREGNASADLLAKEALRYKRNREFDIADCFIPVKKQVFSDNTGIPYLRIPK